MTLPQVTLTGNLTNDPELRYTGKGTALLKLRVACNERKKDDRGEWVDGRSAFLNVNAWGGKAERAAETLKKGDEVIVIGRLSIDKYTDKDGNERQSIEIDADQVASTGKAPRSSAPRPPVDDEDPF